jgi:signal transduction histidine kinase
MPIGMTFPRLAAAIPYYATAVYSRLVVKIFRWFVSLKISTRKMLGSSGDGIQTVIRDSGTGIKQEHLERIFEPFFTTKGDLGTGIGLWVARQLVERRGGQISVASSTEKGSSGTTITIFLPFAIPVSRLATEQ